MAYATGVAKRKSTRFDLVLEVYSDATCSVVVGDTLADAWAYARRTWPSLAESHDPGDEACVIEVDEQCVMLLDRGATFATYAHEAVHVAAWILQSRGMPFDAKNEEGVAYLVEWVVTRGWPRVVAYASRCSPSAS